MTELKMGDVAPEFCANSTMGELSLTKMKDKNVVLYFYPRDMTPGCTIQAQDFSSLYQKFKDLDTEVIGISKDNINSHHKFCEKENIPYPLLVDTEGEICNLYGVMKEKTMFGRVYSGISRATFLINRKQKIYKIWQFVKPNGHAQKVLDAIKILNTLGNIL